MAITWTNGSGGRVDGTDWVKAQDFIEIADQINRRRLLEFRSRDDGLKSSFVVNGWSAGYGVTGLWNEFPTLIYPPQSVVPGEPWSPLSMRWLSDGGSPISSSTPPPSGEVSFFALLNGGTDWSYHGDPWIRAIHVNELRKGCELLTHGLWKFPVYLDGGLFSPLPTTPWFGGAVAYSTTYGELRTAGFVDFSFAGTPMTGLTNVTVRGSSKIWVTGSVACTVEVGRITMPLSVNGGVSRTWGRTWNSPWSTPGGDFAAIGSASLSPGTPVAIPAASAIQTMIDAGPSFQNILIRKTAPDNMVTVNVSASVDVEFDLAD